MQGINTMPVLIKLNTALFILCIILLLTLKGAISQDHFPVPQIEFGSEKESFVEIKMKRSNGL